MTDRSDPTPLQVAEAGGRHAGFLRIRLKRSPANLIREGKALRRRAADHADKVRYRIGYNMVSDDPMIQSMADDGRTRHLQREIDNFLQQAEICEELARRDVAGGP